MTWKSEIKKNAELDKLKDSLEVVLQAINTGRFKDSMSQDIDEDKAKEMIEILLYELQMRADDLEGEEYRERQADRAHMAINER